MFYFMISFVSIFSNKWNKSKVFTFNKNWPVHLKFLNYLRYTEGFTNNYIGGNNLRYLNSGAAQNIGSTDLTISLSLVEKVLTIFIKILVSFWVFAVSIIPYSIFKVKVNNLSNYKGLESNDNFFFILSRFIGVGDVSITNNSVNTKISLIGVTNYWQKKTIFFAKMKFFNSIIFKISDKIYINILSKTFSKLLRGLNMVRVNTFIKQTKWDYYNVSKYNSLQIKSFFNFYLIGLKFFWLGVRYWVVGLGVMLLSFFFFIQLKGLIFNKTVFGYFIGGMFFYWLMSGFVFFIKKYQYSKFTSVIQRFWKRTFIIFWMIEGSLFACFFYLVLNAPEEPLYMYDQIRVYKTHLFSWRWFLIKLVPSILLILLGFYLQMLVRWGLYSRQNPILLFITLTIVYIFWIEFYQFLHVVSYYGNFFWVYDYDEFIWSLELDDRRNRIVNNSVAISLIAKFWHIVFMFIFWVFFILRINEIGRIRYALIAANNQNFVLLYIISWVYMYPWFKYLFRKQLDLSYYWFNMHFRKTGLRVFFIDFKLHIYGLFDKSYINSGDFTFKYNNFFYWQEFTNLISASSSRKSSISNKLISSINYWA